MTIELCPARTADERACIEHLMQFFNYELSAWYPVRLAEHGLYTLRPKGPYWAEPRTQPFLLRVDGELAGFAVVDGECVEPARSRYNLGYFFLVRRFRGRGLARQALVQLLQALPGAWEIYYLARNAYAEHFWGPALSALPLVGLERQERVIDDEPSVWFRFETAVTPTGGAR
ncbi:putative acetyltransferase [Inhella inkyongensis]|uniref:Putative acetyltransferase n=1 Tax=Inhella inkyongensis TaxID=392593 RepID=A0A840S8R4_9BURK|nr:GNAT family N-acetyltransferase [Inhella inkyongensis]MBB5205184.1 putative acetyltransferase [Inhella inkyongensis]